MKKKDEGEPVTLQTPDGIKFPGKRKDDGIKVRYTAKYADKARAEIEHYEKNGYPTGTVTGPDPLDTDMQEARRYMKVAHENADIEKARAEAAGEDPSPDILADKRHALRLCGELCNLREALEGGDVRHVARAGVAFGKALEQMRVRLEASAVKRGRKVRKGAQDGQAATYGTEHEKQERWARYLATCNAIWARNPHMYYSDIVRLAAKEHNVSEVTIKRHCPRKKLDHCPPKI